MRRNVVLVASLGFMTAACLGQPANVTGGAATGPEDTAADVTAQGDTPPTSTTAVPVSDAGPVAAPIRDPAVPRSVYFVMTDRFANGDTSNDTGNIAGGPLDHGFLPEDIGFYHGGDLAGLTDHLAYIDGLGVEAIWITPPFVNRPVQGGGDVASSSAGYHGYWQVDWSRVDPHLGSDEDMHRFVDAAHDAGIDVVFDVVVNHTGDVIGYRDGSTSYVSTTVEPYRTADGAAFDAADVANDEDFPPLDPQSSFPYEPVFASEADADVKDPDWLDDPTMYHNRGNSTFDGESSTLGDFFGLDDLFTERPEVVDGMSALYADVIRRYGIDGFRVDTVKHVNDELWEEWVPSIHAGAAAAGRPDFFVYGEVFSSDPIFNSRYTTVLPFPSLLDFELHDALEQYVVRDDGGFVLEQAFDDDDWYTDADSNASMSVTFFGNHDIGRMGGMIESAGGRDEVKLERAMLGFDLLFTVRGSPVVYYGDEQGFAGAGGDKAARQSMFPAVAAEYVDQDQIGTDATPGDDNFDTEHPLYRRIAVLNELRREHPAFMTGAQIVHPSEGPIFAFSRLDRDERVEYLVVASNGPLEVPVSITALTPDATFTRLLSDEAATVTSDSLGTVQLDVPARSIVVLRAESPLAAPDAPVEVSIVRPEPGAEIPTTRYRIEAALSDRRYAEVTFAVEVAGGEPQVLGTDDAPPYRVYWNSADVADGTPVEIVVTADDGSRRLVSERVEVVLGERPLA